MNDASGPLEKTVTCAEVLAAVGIEDTDGELSSDHNNNNGERSQNHLDEGTPRVEPSNHSEERAARLEVPSKWRFFRLFGLVFIIYGGAQVARRSRR